MIKDLLSFECVITLAGSLHELQRAVHDVSGQHAGQAGHMYLLAHLLRVQFHLLLDVEFLVVDFIVVLEMMGFGELLIARLASVTRKQISNPSVHWKR